MLPYAAAVADALPHEMVCSLIYLLYWYKSNTDTHAAELVAAAELVRRQLVA
jgi:hypothetical protein